MQNSWREVRGEGGRKRREEEGELRGFQSRNRFPLLPSDFPQVLKPPASDGRRNGEAPPPTPGYLLSPVQGEETRAFPRVRRCRLQASPQQGLEEQAPASRQPGRVAWGQA